MFSLLLPLGLYFTFLLIFLILDSGSKKFETLEDKVYLKLSKLNAPIYWDVHLVEKLTKSLRPKYSNEISACLQILERKGKIQKIFEDNRRCILLKSMDTIISEDVMLTLVLVDGRLYMRKDGLNSWTVHDNWIIKLGSD